MKVEEKNEDTAPHLLFQACVLFHLIPSVQLKPLEVDHLNEVVKIERMISM